MGFFKMNSYRQRSPEETLERQTEKADLFDIRVQAAISRMKLSSLREGRLQALLGHGTPMPDLRLSDIKARKRGAEILFDAFAARHSQLVSEDDQTYHVTFVDDVGITSDREPRLHLAALKRKIDKAIRTLNVSAIVVMEVQPLLNYPAAGRGRTLMLHGHAFCWGDTSYRSFKRAKDSLNASRSWNCMFGGKPVLSRRLKPELDDALRISSYIAKLPHDGSYRVPIGNDEWRLRPTLKDYPNVLALRIIEGLSQYTLFDAVFGVGAGRFLRLDWKRQMQAWHQQRIAESGQEQSFDIGAFWNRVRRSGSPHYALPYAIY